MPIRRRFHTRFYITFLPAASSTGFSEGVKQERIPKSDGGVEILAAHFMRPETALAQYRAQKMTLLPPQFYLLTTLAELLSEKQTTPAEKAKIEGLSKGAFGRLVVQPHLIPVKETGGHIHAYPGDEENGGPKGSIHRSVFTKKPAEVCMLDFCMYDTVLS